MVNASYMFSQLLAKWDMKNTSSSSEHSKPSIPNKAESNYVVVLNTLAGTLHFIEDAIKV